MDRKNLLLAGTASILTAFSFPSHPAAAPEVHGIVAFEVQNDAILFSFLSLVALTSSYVLGVLFLKSILSV